MKSLTIKDWSKDLTFAKKPRGHVWAINEYGFIDLFAYESGQIHNGPRCINCGYGFCHHCSNQKTPHKCNHSTEKTDEHPNP